MSKDAPESSGLQPVLSFIDDDNTWVHYIRLDLITAKLKWWERKLRYYAADTKLGGAGVAITAAAVLDDLRKEFDNE